MLADRDYIRKTNLPNKKSYSLVQWITFLSVAFFIVDALIDGALRRTCLLNRESLFAGEIWRLVTSFFMTQGNNPLSVIFDLFVFYFMGRDLESIYNAQTLKSYYKMGLVGSVIGVVIALSLSLRLDLSLFSCLMSRNRSNECRHVRRGKHLKRHLGVLCMGSLKFKEYEMPKLAQIQFTHS